MCLVLDDQTLRHRLATRTTNPFGKKPEELRAALRWNPGAEARYRRYGATIVDATKPITEVARRVALAAGLRA